jgi:hypothetical protein
MAKKGRKLSKKLTVVSLLTGVVMVGSIAFAAWTASGSGSGYAKAGSAAALTTNSVAAVDDLYPTGSADVEIEVANTNPYKVQLSSIVRSGAIVSGNGACDASNGVTFDDQTGLSGAGFVVPANSTWTHTFTNAAHMSNASVDACQGQTFTIPVTISGASTT